VSSEELYLEFERSLICPAGPYELMGLWPRPDETDPSQVHGEIRIRVNGEEKSVIADGNGPISAFVNGMRKINDSVHYTIDDYEEESIGKGADAKAVAYVPLKLEGDGVLFGVGIDTNIVQAAVRAIVSALNRVMTKNH